MPVYRWPSNSLKSLYDTAGSLFGSLRDRFAELGCAAIIDSSGCSPSVLGANDRPQFVRKRRFSLTYSGQTQRVDAEPFLAAAARGVIRRRLDMANKKQSIGFAINKKALD